MARAGGGQEHPKDRRFGVKSGRVNDTSAVNSTTCAAPPPAGRFLILPSAVYSNWFCEIHCGRKGKTSSSGSAMLRSLTIKRLRLPAITLKASDEPSGAND